jgi:oligosaccharide 4-alpha-D-glucosyltransferase
MIWSMVLLICSAHAQTRTYLSHSEENGKLSVVTNDGTYVFTPYSNSIIETMFVPEGDSINSKSHAVVMPYDDHLGQYSYQGDTISFNTNGIGVSITTQPFEVRYSYKGRPIVAEARGYVDKDSLKAIELSISKDEVLYGTGARALGMNRRGKKLPLYNRAHYGYETYSEQMNFSMPLVVSSKQYMVHFDNPAIGFMDLDSEQNNTLSYETISGRMVYQVVAADGWFELLDAYTELTGKQPMIPKWALGNFSSRFGYHTQSETEGTIDRFKSEGIPVDAIILDLYWFGKELKGTMGNLEVYRDSFPDFEGMTARLNRQGVKTITITEPYILTTSNRWPEAVEQNILAKDSVGNDATYDFYFGNTGIIDIFKPEGEHWFWDRYKSFADMGVAGVWGDLGEPEVLPSWVVFEEGTADELHNIYGHNWARLVFEGYARDFPDLRPFILMRAGYSGSQRYGMLPWSGDVNRSWGGFQSQPEIALQMGMQGMAYMHSDLGGFAGANLDDELYVRWLQYGVFNPIYRPHAQEDVPSEPVFRSAPAKKLAKEAIELRYRLLPYNYNLVYENSIKGVPLMRPLFFEEPENEALWDYSEAYLWGRDILVAPVLEAGKEFQSLYLPKGSVWYDFHGTGHFEGGQTVKVPTDDAYIPTYVRAGAFIPMAKGIANTMAYDGSRMELHYFHDEDIAASNRSYYFDDGSNGAFEKGSYEVLNFKAEHKRKWLEIELGAEWGDQYTPARKTIQFMIHNVSGFPDKIEYNNEEVRARWIKSEQVLRVEVQWNMQEGAVLRIKMK